MDNSADEQSDSHHEHEYQEQYVCQLIPTRQCIPKRLQVQKAWDYHASDRREADSNHRFQENHAIPKRPRNQQQQRKHARSTDSFHAVGNMHRVDVVIIYAHIPHAVAAGGGNMRMCSVLAMDTFAASNRLSIALFLAAATKGGDDSVGESNTLSESSSFSEPSWPWPWLWFMRGSMMLCRLSA
eukprot:CAMPEP_0197078470 /NCGR_PEP_ID=MMETSP1384-20130603/213138_1 /TAXON_ID=29189 /ORGANISM="Ammonia sp." /LENGTH=183 /DNA_ID=CAMNT_0042517337 /DNA_START=90 /DNA_END=642 /DNA_ORIENTATION=+